MLLDKGSDLQMPFYMFYLWGWAKVFGTSELALRAANIPWFVAAILALCWGLARDRQLRICVLVIALTNAFLWYYISEARPYTVLFAFSAMTFAALFRLRRSANLSPEFQSIFGWFCFGMVGTCATNLIAVPWAIAALCAFIWWSGWRFSFEKALRSPWVFGLTAITLTGLAFYYLWTLRAGARASDVARTDLTNLAFAFYELVGLSGIGPGRLALREQGVRALSDYAPYLLAGGMAIFAFSAAALIELRNKVTRRDLTFFGICTIFPLTLLILMAEVAHMRLLGRHFVPLLPFLLVFLGVGFRRLLFAPSIWLRASACFGALILAVSALEIRFATRHQRDDYRGAATIARQAIADGQKVWWAADITAAAYYAVPLNSPLLTVGINLNDPSFKLLSAPDVVCLSKPDIYDPDAKIRRYLREHYLKVTRELLAFQIFERQFESR